MPTAVLSTEKLSLDWPDKPCESQSSKLDERFLSGSGSRPARRKLPFFHRPASRDLQVMEVAFLLLVLTNALTKATDVLVDSVTPSLRTSHPLLPPRGSTALSFLLSRVGPTPLWSVILHGSGTGRCGSPHYGHPSGLPSGGTEGDGWGGGVTSEAVKELRRATNLALRAIKHTAQTVGRNMAGLVAAERLLWLNLTEIREKEKVFLLDTQVSSSGLFDLTPSSITHHDVHVN